MAVPIFMPALSPTMSEGNLTKWVKKEGDKVSPGDILAEVETDKATMEIESIDNGILSKILVSEKSHGVKVQTLIAVLLEEGDDESTVAKLIDAHSAPAINTTSPISVQKQDSNTAPDKANFSSNVEVNSAHPATRIFISPLARKTAEINAVEVKDIHGTGPHGRIIREDVLLHIQNQKAVAETAVTVVKNNCRNPKEFEILPISGMRKIIATRLLESKQTIPHFYVSISCQIDALLAMRNEINQSAPQQDGKAEYKISVNDFIIKATAKAMQDVPAVNSSWNNDSIIAYNNIDIAVAVSTDGGLLTPIIRNANTKSIIAISNEMKNLASRARANKLKPEEFQGGGISISNLGMYNIEKFNAIINPPQSCILAVGAGIEKPIVRNGNIEVATVMEVTLSCDHRVIDGAVAAEFANALKSAIEKPILTLI